MAQYLGDGPWDNAVCRGYCIMDFERAGYVPENIKKVLAELEWCFDDTTTEEAGQHYYTPLQSCARIVKVKSRCAGTPTRWAFGRFAQSVADGSCSAMSASILSVLAPVIMTMKLIPATTTRRF